MLSNKGKTIVGVGFSTAILLMFATCKFSTPSSFLDRFSSDITLTNLKNVTSGDAGELYSGFVTGTMTAGTSEVKGAFDDGVYKSAIVSGLTWKLFIPTGAEAAAGKSRWQVGSKHTLKLRPLDANGNTLGDAMNVTFTQQPNKDVNGDGYADIIVGANQNNGSAAAGGQTAGATNKGAAYVFYGSASGVTKHNENATAYYCSGAPDCTVIQNPDNVGGLFGFSAAFAGDVNGDGYADVIVGAYQNNGSTAAGGQTAGATNKGAAYVFYGSASGITKHDENATAYYCSGAPDCTVIQNPDNASGFFGYSVSFAGDVNGDGYADVIVGAYQNNGSTAAGGQTAGVTGKGAAYVFYGSASGITKHDENATAYYCSGAPDCTVMQNPDNSPNGSFGFSVALAGDVNGDGFADVIIGARQNTGASAAGGQTASVGSKGAAYLFYGSASGVTKHDENTTAYYCSGSPDCTVIANPDSAPGLFGYSAAYAGDVNGDGYADVIIGARQNNGMSAAGGQSIGATNKGAAYLFYGSASGVVKHDENATAYYCGGPPDCTVVQNPDNVSTSFFGSSVAFAGDVNGDGYADVVVGAMGNYGASAAGGQTAGTSMKGAAYVFYGSASGIAKHDESATPYYCSGPPDCTVIQNPDNSGGNFGFSVAYAGDVNGDGYPDIIVGAKLNNGTSAAGGQTAGAGNKGAAYVFYGSASGITKHDENSTPYYCSGPPDCTVIQNPDNIVSGFFGVSVAFEAGRAGREQWVRSMRIQSRPYDFGRQSIAEAYFERSKVPQWLTQRPIFAEKDS